MENKALFPNSAAGADDQFMEQLADITAKVLRFTSAGGSAIALVSGPVAVTKASSGNLAPDVGSELHLEGSFAGLSIQTGELLYCEDAESDSRVDAAASAAMGLRSMVMVPIGEKDKVKGVLAAFSSLPNAFRPTHVAVMRTLADIVNELVMRQEQSRPAPVLEMPVRPVERSHVPPTPVIEFSAPAVEEAPTASLLPPEVEKSIAAATNKPQVSEPLEPPAELVERAIEKVAETMEKESAQKTPEQAAPAPQAKADRSAEPKTEAPAPEAPKPLIKDRFERPEPVGSSSGKFAVPKEPVGSSSGKFPAYTEPAGSSSGKFKIPTFEEPSRKDKDLPSIVSLVNAQKKAQTAPVDEKSDILPAAADPRAEGATAAAATKMSPAIPKPLLRDSKATSAAASPSSSPLPTFESPMFSSFEQPSSGSGLNTKLIGGIAALILVVAGAGWGIRSYMESRSAAKAAAAQTAAVTETPSQASPEPTPTSTTSGTEHSTAAAPATTSAPRHEATSTESKQTEGKPATTEKPKKDAILVANSGSVPGRPKVEQVEAPTVAMNGRAEMGALLTTSKTATPTLSVKRSVLSPPEVIKRVAPKVPEFARRTNPAGDRVVLNVTVGADGKVKNVQLVRGQMVFADAATAAVRQWQYRPAFLNGEPVEATVEVVVSFNSAQ